MADVVFGSALRASGGLPSGPAAFPFFNCFNARSISALDGGLTVTLSRRSSVGVMFGISVVGGLSIRLGNAPPTSLILFFGDDNAVLALNWLWRSYSLFIFRCPAVPSASVARVSKNAFWSFLALFLIELPIP